MKKYLESFNLIGIILWIGLAVLIFFLIKKIWRSVLRFFGIGKSVGDYNDEDKDKILDESSKPMSNGYTYRSSAEFLFKKMYGAAGPFPWLYSTDKPAVGEFMLKVKASEFMLLSNIYVIVRNEGVAIYQFIDKNDTLTDDLKDLFSSSEEEKYLSHLKQVM